MALEFYRHLKTHAQEQPDHPALIDGDAVISYKELLEQIERFAGALADFQPGPKSKLGILCLNQKEYLIAFLGALLKGLCVVPFNLLLGPEDLMFIARDAGVDALVVDGALIKPETAAFFNICPRPIIAGSMDNAHLLKGQARPFAEFMQGGDRTVGLQRLQREPGIPDVLLYTSGTTARPKGVMLNENQFYANTSGVLDHLPFRKQDRVILALPLFHSFGNIIALVILRAGGTLILLRQFAPKTILATITQRKATILPLVPTIYSFLVDLYQRGGYDVSSLDYCISGGAALPESLLHKVEQTLNVKVIEGYGLTETSPVIAVNTYRDGSVPGSVGSALNNVELRIVDDTGKPVARNEVGEICVRGPSITTGYWNRPDETRQALTNDGWFKTGDLGHLDEKDRLWISRGRKKDLIIRAGENVSPLAIENVMMSHPDVAEAAAIGVPHDRLGEQVKVCVSLRPGATATAGELKEFCRKKLPAYMTPDLVEIYPELPKNATGKILKTQLRQQCG
jgi:long-chain acyl-CoA synthetase